MDEISGYHIYGRNEYNGNMERKYNYLASANTGIGFVNNFANINPHPKCYDYVLKGSSGSGKSTLMRKVGEYFFNQGYEIEYFYCSSDINSLDGVRIVEKNISIIDGTAPHTIDATIPKINAEIINIGEYINSNVQKISHKIIEKIEKKSIFYDKFYKNLKISKQISDLIDDYLKLEYVDIDLITQKLIKSLNLSQKNKDGKIRELFRSAITKNGVQTLFNNYDKILTLECDNYHASRVLEKVAKESCNCGYEVVTFMDIINPTKINAVFIKELNTLIEIKELEYSRLIKSLATSKNKFIKLASQNLKQAKAIHMQIEKCYHPYINFNGIDAIYTNLITNISVKGDFPSP